MANLTHRQENAVQAAFEEAVRLGLTAEQATEAVAEWAENTNFGQLSVDYSNLPERERSDRPSSRIGEIVGKVIADRNPGMVAVITSGQEPPLGLARLTAGQRREHRAYMAQGFDSETASRIVNRKGAHYRHPLGVAVDTEARDIAGNIVKDRDITDQHAFSFVQATGGNVGRGGFVRMRRDGRPQYYMNEGRNHYDTASLRPRMNQFWGSLGPFFEEDGKLTSKFLQEMQQANALHDMGMKDASKVPFPTGRGVSTSDYIVNALAANTEPEFSGQFAPGGTGLLGADPISRPGPLEYFGPPPPRSDYPTGPLDPEPWQSSFAPAPAYPPRTASREHFEKTFVRPDPHAPMVQSGMSDRARATRDLADGMAQAGIAGLDGRPVAPVPINGEGFGLGSVEAGASPASRTYDPGTRNRIPIPRARPTPSTIPVPTPAPRRGAGLVPTRGAIAPLGPYASGPKQQIFDFVLDKLLNSGRPA